MNKTTKIQCEITMFFNDLSVYKKTPHEIYNYINIQGSEIHYCRDNIKSYWNYKSSFINDVYFEKITNEFIQSLTPFLERIKNVIKIYDPVVCIYVIVENNDYDPVMILNKNILNFANELNVKSIEIVYDKTTEEYNKTTFVVSSNILNIDEISNIFSFTPSYSITENGVNKCFYPSYIDDRCNLYVHIDVLLHDLEKREMENFNKFRDKCKYQIICQYYRMYETGIKPEIDQNLINRLIELGIELII